MKTNIVLIGFMGSGKSAAGRVLARKLGRPLVDVDALIVQQTGRSISQIFAEEGEKYFRDLETEIIRQAAVGENQVIACGGGAVLEKVNVERLKQSSVIVWLKASPESIIKRVTKGKDVRPLLKGKNSIQDIRNLMESRESLYEKAADIDIDTSEMSVEKVVEAIIRELKEYEGFNI